MLGHPPGRLFNSVLIRSTAEDLDKVRQEILDYAGDHHLSQAYALASDEQFSSLYLEKNLAAFATVVPVIVGVTGLSSVFVTFFLLAQWLAKERWALGVLMTLGYTAGSLVRAFMVIIVGLAVVSVGLGIGLGYLLAQLFITEFAYSVGLPIAEIHLTAFYVWVAAVAVAVVFSGAAIYAAVQVSRMTPLDAIRRVSGRKRHPGRLSGWLGARLPPSWPAIRVGLLGVYRCQEGS
ncbi:MAG: FtsX-like permease family protein [Propionibacteriaceae bacterium]|jgi:ABC-type lipoprotein release transport system permease subunit|nr:FtsX-like permease family protein [Propionibacteriaceae bacterium]